MRGSVWLLVVAALAQGCPQKIVVPGTRDGSVSRLDSGQDGGPSDGADGALDAGDLGVKDGGYFDAEARDIGFFDALSFDAMMPDLGVDASFLDADLSDLGSLDAQGMDAEAPLDPELALPDPNGEPCSTPGSEFECPFLKVCRPFTPTQGRCESCAPCGNLNAFCTQTSECDILFTCFRGRCTGFCELGSFNCGPPDACIDVGLSNMHGICEPR